MSFINKFKLLSLIAKYRVELIDHIPGQVTIEISAWEYHEHKLLPLIARLRMEDDIHSVDVEGNIVTVRFNPVIIDSESGVRRLLSFIDEFDL